MFFQKAINFYAGIAQLAVQRTCNAQAGGSSPSTSSIKFSLAKRCLFSIFGIVRIVSYI